MNTQQISPQIKQQTQEGKCSNQNEKDERNSIENEKYNGQGNEIDILTEAPNNKN